MSLVNREPDGIDDYNQSVWQSLGHPAFESGVNLINEDIEWWDIDDEYDRD